MTLVLIHGPPAAGKLALARALARLTGFKLFDNHASIDFALRFFERGSEPFGRVVGGLRRLVLDEAAEAGVSLIFTYVYAHPEDAPYLDEVVRRTEERGGAVALVHLSAPPERLLERVSGADRRGTGKLLEAADLSDILARYDVFTPYPGRPSLRLDSSRRSPDDLARAVAEHFGLPESAGKD